MYTCALSPGPLRRMQLSNAYTLRRVYRVGAAAGRWLYMGFCCLKLAELRLLLLDIDSTYSRLQLLKIGCTCRLLLNYAGCKNIDCCCLRPATHRLLPFNTWRIMQLDTRCTYVSSAWLLIVPRLLQLLSKAYLDCSCFTTGCNKSMALPGLWMSW